MIESTTTYTTSDGQDWKDLMCAEAHEAALSRRDDVDAFLKTREAADRTLARERAAILAWLAWDASRVDEPAQDEAAE